MGIGARSRSLAASSAAVAAAEAARPDRRCGHTGVHRGGCCALEQKANGVTDVAPRATQHKGVHRKSQVLSKLFEIQLMIIWVSE